MDPKRPWECADMSQVRSEIDRIDAALVDLIAERYGYVDRAWQLKMSTQEGAVVQWRIQQVIDRVKATPSVAGSSLTEANVANLGVDPGDEVNEAWWEDMLAAWFDEPEPEPTEQSSEEATPEEKTASEDRSGNRPESRSDSKSPAVK